MKKIITLIFFGLICWMIYIADTSNNHILLKIMEKIPFGDKINHFLLFGSLTFMLNISFPRLRFGNIPGGIILVSVFCVLEEASQLLFPTRNFDIMDLLFDTAGIAFFSYLSYRWGISRHSLQIKKISDNKKLIINQFKAGTHSSNNTAL